VALDPLDQVRDDGPSMRDRCTPEARSATVGVTGNGNDNGGGGIRREGDPARGPAFAGAPSLSTVEGSCHDAGIGA